MTDSQIVGYHALHDSHATQFRGAETLTTQTHICLFKVLMNCVDTGWVTDNAPGGVGAVAQTHATFIAAPLDEEDGAARVLDPVFMHIADPAWLVRGQFLRNYYVAGW